MNKYEKRHIGEAIFIAINDYYISLMGWRWLRAFGCRKLAVGLINLHKIRKGYLLKEFLMYIGEENIERFYDRFARDITI